jgi:hypothetical protein
LGPQPLPLELPGFGTAVPPLLPRKKIKNNIKTLIYTLPYKRNPCVKHKNT